MESTEGILKSACNCYLGDAVCAISGSVGAASGNLTVICLGVSARSAHSVGGFGVPLHGV